MKLTTKLLGYLNRVFNKDPQAFVAFRIDYAGGLSWAIEEGVLSTTVTGGPGLGFTVDLSQYTIATLVRFIAGQTGYALSDLDATRSGLSALVLLDASGDLSQPNGGVITGYTSLLFAWLEAVGSELSAFRANVALAPAQMDLTQAEGVWIDESGSYYDVPRQPGELDTVYAPRVVATVLQVKQNNVAIEIAIEDQIGQAATVVDVVQWTEALYHFDGTQTFNASDHYTVHPVANYGLFDVATAYDLINLSTPLAFEQQITAICNQFRAGGTHLRAISFTGSQLADQVSSQPTDAFTAPAHLAYTDSPAAPPTDNSTLGGRLGFADALNAPNDMTDGLVITTFYRSQDGQSLYDTTTHETLDGSSITGVSPPVPVQIVTEGGTSITDQGGNYLLEG